MIARIGPQTPRSGPCQSGPERVAKALFRDLPNRLFGCTRAVRPDAPAKNAPVAQLDRALDYESRGQEFESLRARHSKPEHAMTVARFPTVRDRSSMIAGGAGQAARSVL